MSTNSECDFIEVAPSVWWYVLEDYDAPKNAFDWREHASAYGPFPTEEKADDHLRKNHANPGGMNVMAYREGYVPDETMVGLMNEARKRDKNRGAYGGRTMGGFGFR